MPDAKVVFSPEAEKIYQQLSNSKAKKDKMLIRAIDEKVEWIKSNYKYGDCIAKALIPADYKKKYGINNLFRVELPCFWRMLYTLTSGEVKIIAIVLDILDHNDYSKRFKYHR